MVVSPKSYDFLYFEDIFSIETISKQNKPLLKLIFGVEGKYLEAYN